VLGARTPSTARRGTSFQLPGAGVVAVEARDFFGTPAVPGFSHRRQIAVTIELTVSAVPWKASRLWEQAARRDL